MVCVFNLPRAVAKSLSVFQAVRLDPKVCSQGGRAAMERTGLCIGLLARSVFLFLSVILRLTFVMAFPLHSFVRSSIESILTIELVV